jgi:hypothetical protein
MTRLTVLVFALSSTFLLSTYACRAEEETSRPTEISESFHPEEVCPNAIIPGENGTHIKFSEVCTVLKVVKDTLKHLEERIDDPDVPLNSVTLNLKTATTVIRGFGINLIIVKFGRRTRVYSINELDIVLVPPEDKKLSPSPGTPEWFSETLANSILASFNAIKSSQLDLKTESFSSSVQFGVEQDTSGGIDTISIYPISINARTSLDSLITQEIVFEYGKKEASDGE